jgi:periplasmic copper chaperone A
MRIRYLFAPVLVAATAPALGCDLSINNGWVRERLPGTTSLAAYGTLNNAGVTALKLSAVSSVDFNKVETHETITVNGVGKMRAAEIDVPAKGSVTFVPGGKHIMLIGPKKALEAGDTVVVQFTDSAGCKGTLEFKVGNQGSAPRNDMPGTKTH